MRIYLLVLCSLATIITWAMGQIASASDDLDVLATSASIEDELSLTEEATSAVQIQAPIPANNEPKAPISGLLDEQADLSRPAEVSSVIVPSVAPQPESVEPVLETEENHFAASSVEVSQPYEEAGEEISESLNAASVDNTDAAITSTEQSARPGEEVAQYIRNVSQAPANIHLPPEGLPTTAVFSPPSSSPELSNTRQIDHTVVSTDTTASNENSAKQEPTVTATLTTSPQLQSDEVRPTEQSARSGKEVAQYIRNVSQAPANIHLPPEGLPTTVVFSPSSSSSESFDARQISSPTTASSERSLSAVQHASPTEQAPDMATLTTSQQSDVITPTEQSATPGEEVAQYIQNVSQAPANVHLPPEGLPTTVVFSPSSFSSEPSNTHQISSPADSEQALPAVQHASPADQEPDIATLKTSFQPQSKIAAVQIENPNEGNQPHLQQILRTNPNVYLPQSSIPRAVVFRPSSSSQEISSVQTENSAHLETAIPSTLNDVHLPYRSNLLSYVMPQMSFVKLRSRQLRHQLSPSLVPFDIFTPWVTSRKLQANRDPWIFLNEPLANLKQNESESFLDSEPEVEPINPEDLENELGDIQIIETPVATPSAQPVGQFLLRSSIFTNSNITGLEDFVTADDDDDDVIFANSAFLLFTPQLDSKTRLLGTVGGGLVRFGETGDSNNYDFLNLGLAAQHQIAPATYGELGLTWQQFFTKRDGERVLSDVSPKFIIGRQDSLGEDLRLDSLYELKARLTDPMEQQRITNTLGVRLNYDINPQWRTALEYRFSLEDFTRTIRFDVKNQLRAVTTYNFNETTFMGFSLSYLFGSSSESVVDLEELSFGLSFGLNVSLF